MKPEELSIGDWVNVLNYHWDGRPYTGQVNGFTKKHGTYYLQFGSALSAEIDRCEPIPITTEILEKNGFYFGYTSNEMDLATNTIAQLSKEDEGWVWDEGAGAVKVIFPTEYDGGLITIDGLGKYMSCVFDENIFIHELQHALRLCGIDKPIELEL